MTGNEVVTLYRDIAIERTSDFQLNGPLSSETFNDELDKVTLILQQLKRDIGRSVRLPLTNPQVSSALELGSSWNGRFLYVNESGELEPASSISQTTLTRSVIGALFYPTTDAEDDAGVTPVNFYYRPGVVDRYATNSTPGTTDMSAAFQAAVDQRINGGEPVVFLPGTYRMDNSVEADGFSGLEIFGYGALIDFRTDNLIKLGDHTVNEDLEFTQTEVTCSDIVIAGLKFKPTSNGWDGSRFAYADPINLSSCENVHIYDCHFEDWDFAAIDINAPSKYITVERCSFKSSQEGSVTYGVRPYAAVENADPVNYDSSDGTLAYSAPTLYHQYVTVRDCYFYQLSHSILSWNVHHAKYVNNTFEKPITRTISVTLWNFDTLIQGNNHIITDNSSQTVSTAVAVGVGSQRVMIKDEHFKGTLSGTGVNDSMKLVDIAAVNEDIIVEGCIFDVTNVNNVIVIGPNVGATIRDNHFKRDPRSTVATIVINSQTASPVSSPGFHQPQIRIVGNTDDSSTRFIELANGPPGGAAANAIIVQDNILNTQLTDGFIATNTTTPGWKVRARGNQFVGGAPTYCSDFGTGKTVFYDADPVALSGSTTFSASDSASVSLSITLPSTSYKVVASSNANKTFWVGSKTTTGWTWNASSSGSDTVDWHVVL
jgi:hypothetical protein